MLDDAALNLWAKVCATVNRLGEPRSPRVHTISGLDTEPRLLDLHGLKIHDAYFVVRDFIETTPHQRVTIVTGRGEISRELEQWLSQFEQFLESIPLNGAGAFAVRLRRR